MKHRLVCEQWLPYPVGTVFAFFATPTNLPPLMPAWQQAKIEEAMLKPPPLPPDGAAKNITAAGVDTKMILSFRPFPKAPFRQNWHARISEFAWNDHFCDVQEKGPFAYWRHCHHVRAEMREDVAGTRVTDDLAYAFWGGPIGDIANLAGGRVAITKIFDYRHEQTAKLLPAFALRVKF